MTAKQFNSDKFRWLNGVCSDPAVSSTSFRVAYTIADHLNKTTRNAWPSQQRIARRLDRHQKTVQRAIKELEGLGWLRVTRRRDGLTSNRYELAWPFNTQDNGQPVEKAKNEGSNPVQPSEQNCPIGDGKNAPQYYLSKLPKIDSSCATEGKVYPRFTDRGKYERELIERIGVDGVDILAELHEMDPSTVERLCQTQRAGALSDRDLDGARLAAQAHRGRVSAKRRFVT
jgi:DNA-binding Lrp family transcriptional regulator